MSETRKPIIFWDDNRRRWGVRRFNTTTLGAIFLAAKDIWVFVRDDYGPQLTDAEEAAVIAKLGELNV